VHYFPSGSAQCRYLAEATLEANRVQARRDGEQTELADWIRFSNRNAKTRRDVSQAGQERTIFAGVPERNWASL
jgi:hypothetical protein